MCYNCGCGMPDDEMGQGHAGVDPNGRAITTKTFKAAADAFGMSVEDAKEKVLTQLQEDMKEKDKKSN